MKLLSLIFTCCLLFCGFNSGLKAQKGSKINTVVIDAGHGGKDPGALGKRSKEKDIALAIALKTGNYIKKYLPDVKVIFTRSDDRFIPLHQRADIANKNSADFFISIHCNANNNPAASGSETYTMGLHKNDANLNTAMLENAAILFEEDAEEQYGGFDANSTESYIQFTLFQNTFIDESNLLASYIQDQFKNRVGRRDRGVHQAGFLVLWRTAMPGVLVELGFISNPTEEKFLMSEEGQSYMASAIYRAFKQYKLEFEKENKPKEVKKPVEQKEIMESDLSFRVQFYTKNMMVELSDPRFAGLKDLDFYYHNGLYKYTSGRFSTFAEAREYLPEVTKKGFEGAFVVAFKNNKRIPIDEARAFE
jgi:N-acetylmuramoyl-L-alanine amidase